jgi:flagellar biosynthesis GTPase FlhF
MSEEISGGQSGPNKVRKEINEGVNEHKTSKDEIEDEWEREEQEKWKEEKRQKEEEQRIEKERIEKLIQSIESEAKKIELTDVQRIAEETLNGEEKELIKEFDVIKDQAFFTHYGNNNGQGFFPGSISDWIRQKFTLSGADLLYYEKTELTAPQDASERTTEGVRQNLLELSPEKLRLMRAALFHYLCIMQAGAFGKTMKDEHYLKGEPSYWEAVDKSTPINMVIRKRIASGELTGRALYVLPLRDEESGKFEVGYYDKSEGMSGIRHEIKGLLFGDKRY